MEQTSTLPVFARRRRPALWLVSEFMQIAAVGLLVLPFVDNINLRSVAVLFLMGQSIWLWVANQPSYPAGSRRTWRALYRAASDRLGWKVSLIWVKFALTIVLVIAFVISVARLE